MSIPKKLKVPKKLAGCKPVDLLHLENTLRKRKNHRRLTVFYHKGTKCCYCNRKGVYLIKCIDKAGGEHIDLFTKDFMLMTIDHIIPRSKGGTRELKNLVPACRKCNTEKCSTQTWRYTYCVWKLNLIILLKSFLNTNWLWKINEAFERSMKINKEEALNWWFAMSYPERKDFVDKNGYEFSELKTLSIFDINNKESIILKLYKFYQKQENIPWLRHEVLDRGILVCDILSEKVLEHEFFDDKLELKKEGRKILSDLYGFVNKVTAEE